MKQKPWQGKHMWIWVLDKVGTPDKVSEDSLRLGLSGVLIKAWDGYLAGRFLEQLSSMVKPAHDLGLIVGAWGYSYGNNISGEVQAMKQALDAGADWLVIDAETEYETPRGPEKAIALAKALKETLKQDVPLGYTTFAIPRYHPRFPYREFSSFCAVCLPQIYWEIMGMPLDQAINLSITGLSSYGLPIAPVGQSFGPVTPAEISAFASACKAHNLEGISYFSWQDASAPQLDAIALVPYGRFQEVSPWARLGWYMATKMAIMDGTDPKGAVTREMLATVLERLGLLQAKA